MTNTINLKLSKRLNELGLLDNIETEFIYTKRDIGFGNIDYDIIEWKYFNKNDGDIKTLLLEEVIDFIGKQMCQMELLYPNDGMWNLQIVLNGPNFKGTLIEVFENFLEYLLDNNLLGQQ